MKDTLYGKFMLLVAVIGMVNPIVLDFRWIVIRVAYVMLCLGEWRSTLYLEEKKQ